MAKKRFSEEQIFAVVKQLEAGGTAAEVAREVQGKPLDSLLVESKVRRHGTERSRAAAQRG